MKNISSVKHCQSCSVSGDLMNRLDENTLIVPQIHFIPPQSWEQREQHLELLLNLTFPHVCVFMFLRFAWGGGGSSMVLSYKELTNQTEEEEGKASK